MNTFCLLVVAASDRESQLYWTTLVKGAAELAKWNSGTEKKKKGFGENNSDCKLLNLR
jgi:hypothetical protein